MNESIRKRSPGVVGAFVGVTARIGELMVRRTLEFVAEAREEIRTTFEEARDELDAELRDRGPGRIDDRERK